MDELPLLMSLSCPFCDYAEPLDGDVAAIHAAGVAVRAHMITEHFEPLEQRLRDLLESLFGREGEQK